MSKIDTIESTPSESDNRIASCSGALDVAKVLVTLLVVIGHVVYYNYTECRFPQQQITSTCLLFLPYRGAYFISLMNISKNILPSAK